MGKHEEERFLYRICTEDELKEAQVDGMLRGNDLDKRSGFIHLSKQSQVSGVLALFFAGREDLVLIQVDSEKLGGGLRYDEAEPGVFFPHFYGPSGDFTPLPLSAATETHKLKLEGGKHVLPFQNSHQVSL